MNDDRIRQLLKQADPAEAPADAALGPRVRRLARRRRIGRAIGGAAVATLLLASGLWFGLGSAPIGQPVQLARELPEAEIQRLEAEVERYALQAEMHSYIAEQLWAAEKRRQRQRAMAAALARPDALERLAQQRERATLILVDHADRLWHEHDLRERALEEYRNAAALFPDTHWAAVARQRLSELENGKAG